MQISKNTIAASLSNNVLTSLFIGNKTDHLIPSLRFCGREFPKTQRRFQLSLRIHQGFLI